MSCGWPMTVQVPRQIPERSTCVNHRGGGILRAMATRGGMTLIEVLVSTAIIAVLLALALPALGSSITQAKRISCTARIQTTAQTTYAYAASWDDAAPGVRQGSPRGVTIADRVAGTIDFSDDSVKSGYVAFFDASYLTNILLDIGGAGDRGALTCPSQPDDVMGFGINARFRIGTYTLPQSFLADRVVFDGSDQSDLRLARSQQLTRVRFPSEKVLLIERRLFHEPSRWDFSEAAEAGVPTPMAFSDGHARLVTTTHPAGATRNGLERRPVKHPFATPNGIWGRDAIERD